MEPRDEAPISPREPTPPAPARITNDELQAVIRRAVELQAGHTAAVGEGVSDADVVRIGQELGLDPASMRLAMAEVRGRATVESGALVTIVGERVVRASRVVKRPAGVISAQLERYLRESEFMIAQRRFPSSTRYVRDSSIAAGLGRFARGFLRPHRPINVQQLDVSVASIDDASCLVSLSVDLATMRGGLLAGVLGGGTVASAGWAVTVWATGIAAPLMLIGIPVVAGSWVGMRAIYNAIRNSLQDRLESLLDRAEHNELG
jgi:hypothetical protein